MLSLTLKICAPIFVIVGLLHLIMGLQADVLLGAMLSAEAIGDPVLDSQNRFYGVAFSVYGFLLFLCARDLDRYQAVLRILMYVFFAAGCARFAAMAANGLPSLPVQALLGSELLLPPVIIWWLGKTLRETEDKGQ